MRKQLSCLNCNNIIHLPNKFCGSSCAATYNNSRRTKKPRKKCPTCGNEVPPGNKFCSKLCGWESKKKHHSPEYNKACKRETYRRYIARKKYQTPIDEDLSAIRKFYIECPPGYEVDHIIPISKGGSHSITNLQYLTKQENRRKSNKLL